MVQLVKKGYLTAYGYNGWNSETEQYQLFATEAEYDEFFKEQQEIRAFAAMTSKDWLSKED